jgi:quinol monooxygenase YgiN
MWEFQVRERSEKRFEKVCGPEGAWARFFAQDEAYIRTELIQDLKRRRIYFTLDFWTSQEAYDEFRRRRHVKYKALDQKFEELTESEREIGRFVKVENK